MVQEEAVLGGCQVDVVMCGSSDVHKEAVINDTGGKFAFGTAWGPWSGQYDSTDQNKKKRK
jgi:hypothetical protein